MAKTIRVFASGDKEGKQYLRSLGGEVVLRPVTSYNATFATWEPSDVRYLAVVIVDRQEGPEDEGSRRLGSTVIATPELSRGRWGQAVRASPELNGGPRYDCGCVGVQIAEVSCFCGQPADMPASNLPGKAYPENRLERDWLYQDCGVSNVSMVANTCDSSKSDPVGPDISSCFSSKTDSAFERAMAEKVLSELERNKIDTRLWREKMSALSVVPGRDARWRELYLDLCRERRRMRLETVRRWAPKFIYTKHFVLGGLEQWAQTAEVSDEQVQWHTGAFRKGAQLCLASIGEDGRVSNQVLLETTEGLIRDPCLSFDAKRLFFSMRQNFQTDDYHLYSMDLATKAVRQITFSPEVDGQKLPCCDVEPCLTADGWLVFQSTRSCHICDCVPRIALNLYRCDVNGNCLHRLAFDQVSTAYPQLLNDGRVIYTRWEYQDRNAYYQQPLFVMNPDGTGQTAVYANNSIYPASVIHARGIPNSSKIIAVISGHHVLQEGKLAIIDPAKGSEGNSGIEYVAGASPDGSPGRQPSRVKQIDPVKNPEKFVYGFYDKCGQIGSLWQYPYALDEDHYLVSFNPEGCYFSRGCDRVPYGVYYMTSDGRRELLAFDWNISCGQAVPVMARQTPSVRPSQIDWRQSFGRFYVQDIYSGPGLKGIARGTVKRIRVVALEYRAAAMAESNQSGILGSSRTTTPIAIDNGSQDAKHVLGEIDIGSDGGAYFEVPARNAVYFQLIDEKGRCVQTMRSWTMVQPGEFFGCVGCHENKRETGRATVGPNAVGRIQLKKLEPFAGLPPYPLLEKLEKEGALANVSNFLGVHAPCSLDPKASVDGFSYTQIVQPILDKHCVACHQGNTKDTDLKKRSPLRLTGEVVQSTNSYYGAASELRAFTQSYTALTSLGKCTPLVNWIAPQEIFGRSEMLPPYACGSATSKLMDYLEPAHYNVCVSENEKRRMACWIDLAVPFCGSYVQANTWTNDKSAWSMIREWLKTKGSATETYSYYQLKRAKLAKLEIDNIKAMTQRDNREKRYGPVTN